MVRMIKDFVKEWCDERGLEVQEQKQCKSGISRDVMVVMAGELNPSIPVEKLTEYYESNGYGAEEIREDLNRVLINAVISAQNTTNSSKKVSEVIYDFENIRENIFFDVVRGDADKEWLESVPYKKLVPGVIAICRIDCNASAFECIKGAIGKDGEASIVVTNAILNIWNITKGELFKIAKNNMKSISPSIRSLASVIAEINPEIENMMDISSIDLHVLMPPFFAYDKQTLSKIADERELDYLGIIPSSRFEALLLPLDELDENNAANVKDMVMCVNSTEVSAEDKLCDNFFVYERETNRIHTF